MFPLVSVCSSASPLVLQQQASPLALILSSRHPKYLALYLGPKSQRRETLISWPPLLRHWVHTPLFFFSPREKPSVMHFLQIMLTTNHPPFCSPLFSVVSKQPNYANCARASELLMRWDRNHFLWQPSQKLNLWTHAPLFSIPIKGEAIN